jgi:Domain of unknown function (DUF4440)/Domain of unknown function (DUF3471)
MRIRCCRSLFALAAVFLCSGRILADEPAITQEELVRRTQELFDAVMPGDPTPWRNYYADDCLYHDEKGRSLKKAALVADITPLPEGYSGTIKLRNPESRITADTAVLSYDLDETETIFGQELYARYHEIDTWLKRNGNWQIIAAQAFRYYEDPAVGKADPAKFPDYAGSYELSPDSPRKTTITSDGGKLVMARAGGKAVQLLPESGDLFFRKGVEGRILFRFDANGKVDALIDRRNNEDVIWKKIQ